MDSLRRPRPGSANGTWPATSHRRGAGGADPHPVATGRRSSPIYTRSGSPMRATTVLAAVLAPVLLAAAPRARAQVGSTTDILTGHIVGPDSQPIEGAQVEATSVETQIMRRATSDAHGVWTIVFPDGGGQYTVTIHEIGLAPAAFTLARQADEDRLVADVVMTPTAARLATVVVRGRRGPPGGRERPTPGSTERTITADQAARLPIDASDLTALATLAPGVVGIDATDSTASSFSVAGQRPTLNSITLDGLTFGAQSVPQDAVRATRVITNTYDVARGQFTGGQVASTTRGGTNVVQGTLTGIERNSGLELGGNTPGAFNQAFAQHQISGGLGGPLIHNELFAFGALQLRRRTNELASFATATPLELERLGIDPDTAAALLSTLGGYGVEASIPGLPAAHLTNDASGIARVDWLLADSHTLMLRGDWRLSGQDGSRISPLSLPTNGGQLRSSGGGLMVALTSRFGTSYINELRVYGTSSSSSTEPYLSVPEGRVQIASRLADSTRGVSVLSFGGNPSLPTTSADRYVEASDEFSWLSPGGAHRVKLGTLVNADRPQEVLIPNQLGTFTFPSLQAFDSLRPSSFTRTIGIGERGSSSVNGAVYLGDTWRLTRAIQLTYGLRAEGSTYGGAPPYDAAADSAFGLRTDVFPSDARISPRAGFSWIIGGNNGFGFAPPTAVIRGGIGEFRARAPAGLFADAQAADGLNNGRLQVDCFGPQVPTPDWPLYQSDPSSIPTTCDTTVAPPPSGVVSSGQRATVTAFEPDFEAPRAWRGSLGIQRRVLGNLQLSVDGSWSRGTRLYGVADADLRAAPRFTLPDEGGRPVYVDPRAIAPFGGTVDYTDSLYGSRRDPAFAHAYAINSALGSATGQVTVSLGGFTMRGIVFQTAYTFTHARDQSSFSGGSPASGFASPTTAGNPNVVQWARSDLERRHSFVSTISWPVIPSIELTAIGRLSSGAPYTPMVGSDINGDGARNDRAFIFNPAAAPDSALANGMTRLLETAPAGVRDCLRSQLGSIADRNSCTAPWYPSLDLQANFRPAALGLDRRLTISVVALNPLAGLDRLLHGADDLRGWGQPARPDATLLYVRGFDPNTDRYIYQVNERFGNPSAQRNVFVAPFQISLQARYAIGPDAARDRIRAAFGGGGGGARGGGRGRGGFGGLGGLAGEGPQQTQSRLAQLIPNPVEAILKLRDSLALTADQVARLQPLSDSVDARSIVLADSIYAAVVKAGSSPDPRLLFGAIRPYLERARDNAQHALDQAHSVLTPAQWGRVPDSIRNPQLQRRPRNQSP